MNTKVNDNYKIIRRHPLLIVINIFFSLFLLFIAGAILYINYTYSTVHDRGLQLFILFPLIFLIINFAIIRLMLFFIHYRNNLIIILPTEIVVIKSTLIDTDNIEVIDNFMVTKLDTRLEGVLNNIFSYGDLIIEQNRDRTRVFKNMYKPYRVVNQIKEMKKNG